MKKILIKTGVAASLLGVLLIPVAVTHAGYYMNGYYGNSSYMQGNYNSYNNNNWNRYSQPSYNYNYQYSYSYPNNDEDYYNNNYSSSYYNQYPENYYYPPVQSAPSYSVTHICGPNSTYNPAGDDCDCWSGYVSQNNICVIQPVVYNYTAPTPAYYNAYGLLKPVAVCNDGSLSYSPVGTCWLNGGVQSWTS